MAYPQADNRHFAVPAGGANCDLLVSTASPTTVSEVVSTNTPADEDLVRPAIQKPIQDEVMYFVLPDRICNANPANDEGAFPGGTLAETGFKVDDKAFYHGGDLAGHDQQAGLPAGHGHHLALADAGVQEPANPAGQHLPPTALAARITATGSWTGRTPTRTWAPTPSCRPTSPRLTNVG